MKNLFLLSQYPEPGSNRHSHYWPLDFKSSASTYSAIRAYILDICVKCVIYCLKNLCSPFWDGGMGPPSC